MDRVRRLVGIGIALALTGCGDGSTAPGADGGDAAVMPGGDGGDAAAGGDGAAAPDLAGAGDAGTLCGNGVVDYAAGEECDDTNRAPGDGCDPQCAREKPPTCGDGRLDIGAGEQCDDSNLAPGDGCSPTCQFERVGASCGNMMRDPREVCDDGNTANGDACNPTCNLANDVTPFVGMPGQTGTVDGIGMAARFAGTGSLTADARYLWVGDAGGFRVRRVDIMTATVTTVAGSGQMGFRDSPTGALAQFNAAESIATDGTTVWVSDNRRIRAISTVPPHAVTTVAGTGMQGAQDGPANMATFDDPRGLTYYAGSLYLVDAAASTLRRLHLGNGTIMTIAGVAYQTGRVDGPGPMARFMSPRYMASDNSGMLYIADTNGNQIRAYNTVNGNVTTFAGSGQVNYLDGVGAGAAIHRPRGMTSDGTSVYFVEFNQHTVRQAVLATASVTTLAGMHCGGAMNCAGGYAPGVGVAARFNNPWSIAYHHPSGSLFVFDSGNRVISRIR